MFTSFSCRLPPSRISKRAVRSNWIDGPDVHIEAVAVQPRFRRKGAGRQLLDHVDRQGLRAKCRRTIFHSNAQAFENLAYFRGKGLQETDRRTDHGYTRVVMERYLR